VDVAVAGAGFAGLALARVCARAGLDVTILERRPRLEPEGAGILLQPNGLAVLSELGLLEQARAVGHRFTAVSQADPSGRVRARVSYDELDHPHPYLVTIRRTSLISVLAHRLPERAELICEATVTGLERPHGDGRVGGLRFTDESGAEHVISADYVVGADGAGSSVRGAQGTKVRWRTGPDPYLVGVGGPVGAQDVARLYCGPGWCDGVIPLGDASYFFDHVTDENRGAVQSRDFEAWRRCFCRRVPEAERLLADISSFERLATLTGRTHRAIPRVAPGLALIGDAAAAVHPHSGQGLNRALEEALTLGQTLARHGTADDQALRRWARACDARTRRAVPWSLFIGRVFDGPGPGWRAIRRFSYAVSRFGPIRRDATRRQAGLR
jgi:2-polyprenyl-6-methoxyphenol hydroxylase-like FAD-dependent oxidoreductase